MLKISFQYFSPRDLPPQDLKKRCRGIVLCVLRLIVEL